VFAARLPSFPSCAGLRTPAYLAQPVLTRPRISRSLVVLLALLVAGGAIVGDALSAAGLALLVFLLAALDPKPAWKFWFDPPGSVDSGRAGGRFLMWRRLGPSSPRQRLPRNHF
jgi:hypothetical protein